MKIEKIDHVAILVKDLSKAEKFFLTFSRWNSPNSVR